MYRSRVRTALFFSFFLLILSPILAFAADEDITYISSSLWTGAKDVVIDNNYAYAAFINGLVVFDITIPETPVFISKIYFPGSGEALYKQDSLIYLADGDNGVIIIDVTNPVNPSFIQQIMLSEYIWDVFVNDSLAYIADDSGLWIYSITNPSDPQYIGFFYISGGCNAVIVRQDSAYVAAGTSGLWRVDVSDPTLPGTIDNYNTSGTADALFLKDDLIYVADLYSGLKIFRIDSLPLDILGEYSASGWIYDVFVVDTLIYVATGMVGNGLVVLNGSDPSLPDSLGYMPTSGYALGLHIDGTIGAVASGYGGLHTFNILNPIDSMESGFYPTPDIAYDVYARDSLVYLADGLDGLRVVNMSDPNRLDSIGWFDSRGAARGIAVRDNYLFLADDDSGLTIIDISNPAFPFLVDTLYISGRAYNVAVLDDYAYLASGNSGLRIVNISNLFDIYLEGFYDTASVCYDVAVRDSIVCLAFGSSGLVLVNVADPEAPYQIGNYPTSAYARGLFVEDTLVYLANADDGLKIINIADPTAPILIDSLDVDGYAREVYVQGGRAYLSVDLGGIVVVDIRNPADPYILARYNTPGQTHHLSVINDNICVADQYSLIVLKTAFDCPIIECPSADIDTTICSGQEICLEIPISDASSVTSNIGSWNNDTLCIFASGSGSYAINLTAANEYCDVLCEFTMNVYDAATIEISPENINFTMTESSPLPTSQSFYITSNCDSGSLNWQLNIVDDGGWLEVDKTTGSNPDEVIVSITDTALELSAGIYSSLLELTDANASNSPIYISVSLFIESGVDMGDEVVEPGSSFGVPIHLFTVDSLLGFTIPLIIKTVQPEDIQIDSIVINPIEGDSSITGMIVNDTSVIVFRPIQEPPVPDSSESYEIAYVYLTTSSSISSEVVVIDTAMITTGKATYNYEFIRTDSSSFVPEFNPGFIYIGGHDVLTGQVSYYDSRPVADVMMLLGGSMYLEEPTNSAGQFGFDSLMYGDYVITPSREADDVGVSVADIIKIRRLLAKLEFFDNNYKCIAADVNNDCRISIADVIKIRRYLAELEDLAAGNWKFVDKAYNFDCDSFCTDYPAYCPFPESISLGYDGADKLNNDFVAVRTGDVNGTWGGSIPAGKLLAETSSPVHINIADVYGDMDQNISVPISICNSELVAGLELHLHYNSQQLRLIDVVSELPGEMTFGEGNFLNLIWENMEHQIPASENRVVAELKFEIIENFADRSKISLFAGEIVDYNGRAYAIKYSDGSVGSDGKVMVPTRFSLRQNYPNPFNPVTTIELSLPKVSDYTLDIYNIIGQLVRKISGTAGAGIVHIVWDGKNSEGENVASGIYLYRATAGEFVASRKMLLLK